MYRISKLDGYLLVELNQNFDLSSIQVIIHHVTSLSEYPDTNDIWLIGNRRAEIHLGEIEQLVKDFQCCCPRNAQRRKTGIVVNEGLTGAIIELWAKGLRNRVAFEIEIFKTLEEAKKWLGVAKQEVA